MKEGKSAIYGQFLRLVPVLEQGGTGTMMQRPNGTGTTTSCIYTLLSQNSYTDSIGNLC